jgi:two-component system response regulator CpxR
VAHRILLIDDDSELCSLMGDFLTPQGLDVEFAYNGSTGLARALEDRFDLIILDVMLPLLDGFEVLAQVRRRSAVPIIMLTARTEQRDRVRGLNAGADDYLPKPFGPEELLARIRAVLRRSSTNPAAAVSAIECGGISLHSQTREVRNGDRLVELTTIEFEILDFLMRAAGRVVSRDELTTVLYQRQSTPYERALDVHISHLRKKLESDGRPLIRTVRGVGYLFSAQSGDAA